MDAAAYLANQGWQGNGHALHHSGRGITKPVHIPQKANVLGVGKKQHDTHADQWWARAFDDTLKGLNTSKNDATGKTERVSLGSGGQALQIVRIGGTKRIGQGSLYNNFVKGESLSGTLIPEEKDHPVTQSQSEDHRKQRKGSNNADLPAVVPKDVKRRKKKRRQRGRATAGYLKLVDCDSVHQCPLNVGLEEEYQKPLDRPEYTEADEQRRQMKRVKESKRGLEAGESQKYQNSLGQLLAVIF